MHFIFTSYPLTLTKTRIKNYIIINYFLCKTLKHFNLVAFHNILKYVFSLVIQLLTCREHINSNIVYRVMTIYGRMPNFEYTFFKHWKEK
jgi:hypothetical protein